MTAPSGTLTEAQLAIMDLFWSLGGQRGLTASEIWDELLAERQLARNTVVTMISRLEKRGWLIRQKGSGVTRYKPSCQKAEVASQAAKEVVNQYYGGSSLKFVMSILGEDKLSSKDVAHLKKTLAAKGRRK